MSIEDLDGLGIRIPASQLDIKVHNGYVTLKNPKTGDHRTVRITTVKKKSDPFHGSRRVALLTGPDNGSSYTDFGFITKAGTLVVYPSKGGADPKSFHRLLASMLVNPKKWEANKGAEYRIAGICRRCNRKLTRPDSIDDGMGAECRLRSAA